MFRVCFALLIVAVVGYPEGAPCVDTPGHGQQQAWGLYSVTFPSSYAAGTPLTINVTGSNFAGIHMGVYKSTFLNTVGQMQLPSGEYRYACGSSTITQTNGNVNKAPRSFVWNPPATLGTGSVTLFAILLPNQNQYYKNSFTITEFIPPTPPSPPAPVPPQPADGTSTTLTARWSMAGVFPGSDPATLVFTLEIRQVGAQNFAQVAGAVNINATQATATGLTPFTAYEFRVLASSSAGASAYTDLNTLTTLSNTPQLPSMPLLSFVESNATGITLEWTASNLNGATFVGYKLQMARTSITPLSFSVVYNGNALRVSLNGLLFATNYTFQLSAVTFAGESPLDEKVLSTLVPRTCPSATASPCSGHGSCTDGTCRCERFFFGTDCSIVPSTSPIAMGSVGFFSFAVDGAYVWVGIENTQPLSAVAPTFSALMLNPTATDGMIGDCWMLFSDLRVENRRGIGKQRVPPLNTPSLLENVVSFPLASSVYAYFKRPLIPFTPSSDTPAIVNNGAVSHVSWSGGSVLGDGTPNTHTPANRGKVDVNFFSGSSTVLASTVTQYQLLAWLGGLVIIVITSTLFLRVAVCRKSAAGMLCLRRRLCTRSPQPYGCVRAVNALTHDAVSSFLDLTVGEMCVVVVYIAVWIVYFSLARPAYNDIGRDMIFVIGHLTAIHLTMTLLLVPKNSIWLYAIGIPFERAIRYHRWIARSTILLALVHGATMLNLSSSSLSVIFETIDTVEGKGNLYGVLAFLCFFVMGVFAFEPIRRHNFEVFQVTHGIFSILAWVFSMLHSNTTWKLLIAPVVLWFLDVVVFMASGSRKVKVISAQTLGDAGQRVTHLCLALQDGHMFYEAGQYCFLNCPQISSMQWHPISISSAHTSLGHFTFHIKDMGVGSWSNQLAGKVADLQSEAAQIKIAGPYGSMSVKLEDYPVIIMCAGGVGITPMMSTYMHLVEEHKAGRFSHLRRVELIWVCQDEVPLHKWFPKLQGTTGSPIFKVRYFATRGGQAPINVELTEVKENASASGSVAVQSGRPQFGAIFTDVCLHNSPERPDEVAVLSCGPAPMVIETQNAASNLHMHFHKETFLL